jgi:protein-tyrosine-phosphatase
MLRVLFLCTANSARSQIAEALLRQKGGDRFTVASAGITPADRVDPHVVTLLGQTGIDWSKGAPKGLEAVVGETWDIIITTCDKGRESCPSFPGQPIYAHWSVPDPAAAAPADRDEAFADTVRLLSWRIDLMLTVRLDSIGRRGVEETLRKVGTESPDPQSSTPI